MARIRNCKPGRLKATSYIFLLLSIPFLLAACAVPLQPRYQPTSEVSIWSPPFQGYESHQIDERTYLVIYRNYIISGGPRGNLPTYSLDEKWLEGAQEYVLYRAGDLAKSKGAHSFVVLHKDDWNIIPGRRYGPWFEPSALVLMRILDKNASSIPVDGEYVYEADKLLDSLAKQNIGLAEHRGMSSHLEGAVNRTDNRVIRWRSSVITSDTDLPLLPLGQFGWLGYSPKTEITKMSSGVFDIAMSGYYMVSPLELLSECIKLADREGYRAFKLENWTVEEHRVSWNFITWRMRVWFRTKAHVVLQQHQKKSEDLESVFVVEEIRSNVNEGKFK